MDSALNRVRRVINQCDVLIEVVDARFPTRSKRLERMVRRRGKKLLLVTNKVDLVRGDVQGIPFSTKTGRGKRELMRELERLADGEIRVGVIGRPNVGKSSLINALRGRRVARTSARAGFTRGEQWIRLSPKIMLVDSPGVITWSDEEELLLEDALDVDKARDPVSAALKLFSRHPEVLEELELKGEGEEALEEFARKTGKLKKGGEPNVKEAARMIIRRWQRGDFHKPKNK